MALKITVEQLSTLHKRLYPTKLTETHLSLYAEAAKGLRGLSSREKSQVGFEAAFLLALAFTRQQPGDADSHNCYLFIPDSLAEWARGELARNVSVIFEKIKGNREAVGIVGGLIRRISTG